MLIYADTNIYARPFDDQAQRKIQLEAEACVAIFEAARNNIFDILGSDILKLEIERTEIIKKLRMKSLLCLCLKTVEETEKILVIALKIQDQCRVKSKDALHLASAINGGAIYFLTCDDELIKKSECIQKISKLQIINPLLFIYLNKI